MSDTVRYSAATTGLTAGLEILTDEGEWIDIECGEDAIEAITEGKTQVAALVAVLSLAVEYQNNDIDLKAHGARSLITKDLDELSTSSPEVKETADKLKQVVIDAAIKVVADGRSVRKAYVKAAEQLLIDAQAE